MNPAAGRGSALRRARELAELLPGLEIAVSRDAGHAAELARVACARGRPVLAVGGDGHVAAVAGEVVAGGGVLGIVPCGRGNDFARQLGSPSSVTEIAAMIRGGSTRAVDVIDAGGRVVVGSVYAGVDSVASEIVNTQPPVPGPLLYPYAAVRALLTFRPVEFHMVIDGAPWDARGFTVVIANSGFYGGGMHIVPTAQVDDGVLDVLLVKDSSRFALIAALREVYAGTHLRRSDIELRRGREVTLRTSAPIYADGEPLVSENCRYSDNLHSRARSAALRVLTPR